MIVADFFDEGAVDHDAVERTVAQATERHVAGAEIVDQHAHALAAQLVQRGEAAAAGRQHLFGDFEIEMRGLDARLARRVGDVLGEALGRQVLARRRSPTRAGAG